MLEDSLATVGLGRSIVVDRNGIVLAGNSTQEHAVDQGFDEAIEVETNGTQMVVVRRTDLDLLSNEPNNRARLLSYYDNRTAQTGVVFDPEQLLADMNAGLDLSKLWQPDELDALLADLNADTTTDNGGGDDTARPTLSDRFIVPPFSVLDARQGYWQERKRQWLALGIQSELGRGNENLSMSHPYTTENRDFYTQKTKLETELGRTLTSSEAYEILAERGDVVPGQRAVNRQRMDNGLLGESEQARTKYANGKSPARTSGQDLMRGEHVVGDTGVNLTWVKGRELNDPTLDDTSRKILAATPQSGTSIFDPVLCELAYRWFSPPDGAVLDPFAGGSVRGIVAAKLGRAYTGIDLRAEQVTANEAQGADITPDSGPRWIVGDSRNLDTLLGGEAFDFVFSCPPYFDLEIYSDDTRDLSNTGDYGAFMTDYREIIAAACKRLNPNRFACFVVGDIRDKKGMYRNFVSDTIGAFLAAGLKLYNEAILVTSVGSLPIRVGKQFESGRKLGKTHQNVLVFVKGDPKIATQDCGPVEVVFPEGDADGDSAAASSSAY